MRLMMIMHKTNPNTKKQGESKQGESKRCVWILLAFWCLDLSCALGLSGQPPNASSSPPPSATTFSARSRLYRSYSSPSSVEHGIVTWLASRDPNQSIRPLVLTSVQTASTDSLQKGDALENAANVATVVTAVANTVTTVGGGVMVKRMDEREEGRVKREEGRVKREEGRVKREEGRVEREKRWRVEDRNREERWRVEDRNREERWRVEDRNREERWRVEDRKSQRQRDQLSCTLTLRIIFLLCNV